MSVSTARFIAPILPAAALACLLVAAVGPGSAWCAETRLVDGVAAIVGRDVILLSDVDERVRFFEAQLTPAARDTMDSARLREEILESMIDDNLLVAEATRAGVEVTTGEVTEGVEKAVARVRANFPSQEAFETELAREGLDISSLRQSYREIVRRQMLAQRVVQREIYARVKITDAELRTFYDEHRDEIPPVPDRVTLEHILIRAEPSAEALSAIEKRISEIRSRVDRGENFADLAKEFSEAPGAERGGPMGTFGRGDLDPSFAAAESVALTLDTGQVSAPVRTPLGWHLIRVDERSGERVRASQILLRIATTAADSTAARGRAEQVAREAREGTPFGELAREHSSDPATRDQGGRLGTFALADLTPLYQEPLESAQEGAIVGPIEAPDGFQVLHVAAREGSRTPSFEEVIPELRQTLTESKARDKYLAWVAELREKIHIRVVRAGTGPG